MQPHVSERCRNVLVRGEEGDTLPRSLVRALEEQGISSGWLRGGGILSGVELRTFGERTRTRLLRGPVQLVSLEGSVGQLAGRVSVGLRAVLVYETERGVETVAGEIVHADVLALEALVTVFDDLRLERELDDTTGTWMLASTQKTPSSKPLAPSAKPSPPAASPAPAPVIEAPAGWGAAIAASEAKEEEEDELPIAPKRKAAALEALARPRSGDFVEHFTFGRCEVLRADGDRIKIKVPKDGRIREISLTVLRVVPIEGSGPKRSFRLERRTE